MNLLSKKQLETAITCSKRNVCQGCNLIINEDADVPAECVELVAETALAYREMLEEVIKHLSHCPFCKINRPWLYKHKDGCKLAALLKESEGEEG